MIMMNNPSNASAKRSHSTTVLVAGVLLGAVGLSMVGIGACWDVSVPGEIYTVSWKEADIPRYEKYRHHNVNTKNHALIYQGFMVFISVVPALMHLHKGIQSTVYLLLLSAPISLAGGILGAIMSGLSWKAVFVIHRARLEGRCRVVNSYCSCQLPSNDMSNRTANMEVTNCNDIKYLHSIITAYFVLSILSAILAIVVDYKTCTICWTPEEKQDKYLELPATSGAESFGLRNFDTKETISDRGKFNSLAWRQATTVCCSVKERDASVGQQLSGTLLGIT